MYAICYLAQQELPFRGYLENAESENRGNYLEYLYHRAQYNQILCVHLESSSVFVGNSHDRSTTTNQRNFEIMQTKSNVSYCSKKMEEFETLLREQIAVINNDLKTYCWLYCEIIDTRNGS
jgi:hypothetical protein